jgi:hypothetical protein
MGEPSLFMNNSPRTTVVLMRFLFGREDIELNDTRLTKLTNKMRLFFVLYVAAFVLVVGAVFLVRPG